MKRFFLACLAVYRGAISPILPTACRFYPSCSQYAEEAIGKHGAWRGALLTLKRLLRCHPFAAGGYDPVPEKTPASPVAHSLQPPPAWNPQGNSDEK